MGTHRTTQFWLCLAALLGHYAMAGEADPAALRPNRERIAKLCASDRQDDETEEILLDALETVSLTSSDPLWWQAVDKLRAMVRPAVRSSLVARARKQAGRSRLERRPYHLSALLCALGPVVTADDLDFLTKCLALGDDTVRDAALRAMVDLGTAGSLELVEQRTGRMGLPQARMLAESYHPPAVAHLVRLYGQNATDRLKDPARKKVENDVILGYLQKADARVLDGLVKGLLTQSDRATMRLGVSVLKRVTAPANVHKLRPLLEHELEAVFLKYLDALVSFAGDETKDALATVVEAKVAAEPRFRGRGLTILGRMGKGKRLLIDALSRPKVDRFLLITVCRAAADLGDQALAAKLLPMLGHAHFDVRMEACDALGILKARAAVEQLRTVFKDDPDFFVKDAAARALTKITGQEVRLIDHPAVQARVKANARMPERRKPKSGCPLLGLIPEPQQVALKDGVFEVDPKECVIAVEEGALEPDRFAAATLAADVERFHGLRLRIVGAKEVGDRRGLFIASLKGDAVTRELAERLGMQWDPRLGDQGYLLTITPSVAMVRAESPTGRYYGAATLLQLLKRDAGKKLVLPALEIVDWPTLRFRGFMGSYQIPGLSAEQSARLLSRFKFNFCRGEGTELARKYHLFDLPEAPCGGHCGPPILGLPRSMWEAFGPTEPGPCPVAFGMHQAMGEAIRRKVGKSVCPYWFARADETSVGTDPRSQRFVDPKSPAFKGGKRSDQRGQVDTRGWIWSYHWAKNVIEPTRDLNRVVVLWSDTVSVSQDTFVQFVDKKDVLLVPWVYGGDGSGRTRRWQAYGMVDRVVGMPTLGTGGSGVMHPANLGNGFPFIRNLSQSGAAGVWQSLWADYVVASQVVPWIATAHLGWSVGRSPPTQEGFTAAFLPLVSEKIFGDREVLAIATEILKHRVRVPNLADKKGQAQFVADVAGRFASAAGRGKCHYDQAALKRGFADLADWRRELASLSQRLQAKQTWEEVLKDVYCCEAERRLHATDYWLVFAAALIDFDQLVRAYESKHKRSLLEPPAQAITEDKADDDVEDDVEDDELDGLLEDEEDEDPTAKALTRIRERLAGHVKRHDELEKWSARHRYPKARSGEEPIAFFQNLVKEMASALEAYKTQKFVPENTLSRCRKIGHELAAEK